MAAQLANAYPSAVVINMDISTKMAEAALAKGITSVVGDVCSLPFADDSFDVVIMRQVLQYLSSPQTALSECRRVLRQAGRILIAQFVPYDAGDQDWLRTIMEQWQPLKNLLPTEEELRCLIEHSGFRVASIEKIDMMESLSLWLTRYDVRDERRQLARIWATSSMEHASPLRRILCEDDDVLFSNLFILLTAHK